MEMCVRIFGQQSVPVGLEFWVVLPVFCFLELSVAAHELDGLFWARMHHKVVGNFRSEADVRSLYFRGFRFNETSDNGACTHGQPAK